VQGVKPRVDAGNSLPAPAGRQLRAAGMEAGTGFVIATARKADDGTDVVSGGRAASRWPAATVAGLPADAGGRCQPRACDG
jgi:hypothetical protein